MPAAQIIGTTSVATGGTASTSSPSAAMPSGTQGQDLLLAFHAIGSSSDTVTFPAGWSTPVRNTGTTGVGDSFSWKIASGSAGSATTESALVVTSGSNRNHGLVVMAVRLSDNTSPIIATASSTITPANTTKTCPGATAAGDILEVNFVTDHPAGSTSTVSNWVAPSGFTIRGAPNATQNGFLRTSIAVGTNNTNPTSTGSMPTRAWTTSLNCVGSAWSVAVKSGTATVTPTLTSRLVGIGKIRVKTADATSVRLKIGTDTAVSTGVTFTAAQTPDAEGYTTHDVSGLAGNSTFYYRVAMTDSASTEILDTAGTVGRIKTKASGSFAFTFAACCDAADSASMSAIATRADDFFLHLGDFYYADASGTTAANFRAKFDAKITATNHAAVFATTPSAFIPSDHDGGMNNNYVGTGDTTARDNYSLVYRERIPTTPTPATTGVYHAFSWGRVRFIMMDCRSFKSATAATDNSSKTMLGTTQKQWVKDEITNATEPVIILVGDVPWTGATTAGADHWAGYNTERQELVTHFATVPTKRIGYLGGDMHAVAADDGTNSAGSIPTWQAAPLNNSASIKGGPYSAGVYPASGSAVVQQYGRMVVTDSGSTITFAYTGYSSDNTARITQTTVFDIPTQVSGTDAAAVADAASVAASLAGADTAAAADVASLAATLTGTDTAAAANTATLAATGAAADTGAGVDAATLTVSITAADTAAAADNGSVGTGTPVAASDAASAANTAALAASGTTGDTGAATDAASLAVALSAGDAASAVDAASVDAGGTPNGTDTAAVADAASVVRSSSTADTGSTADSGTLAASITAADSATAVDSATVTVLLAATENASATDLAILAAAQAASDLAATLDAAAAMALGGEPEPERYVVERESRTLLVDAEDRRTVIPRETRRLEA